MHPPITNSTHSPLQNSTIKTHAIQFLYIPVHHSKIFSPIQQMASFNIACLLIIFSLTIHQTSSLSSEYYSKTCPKAEEAVTEAVKAATANDPTVPAALLRMHFHDCFIRVCMHIFSSSSHIYIYIINFS